MHLIQLIPLTFLTFLLNHFLIIVILQVLWSEHVGVLINRVSEARKVERDVEQDDDGRNHPEDEAKRLFLLTQVATILLRWVRPPAPGKELWA